MILKQCFFCDIFLIPSFKIVQVSYSAKSKKSSFSASGKYEEKEENF